MGCRLAPSDLKWTRGCSGPLTCSQGLIFCYHNPHTTLKTCDNAQTMFNIPNYSMLTRIRPYSHSWPLSWQPPIITVRRKLREPRSKYKRELITQGCKSATTRSFWFPSEPAAPKYRPGVACGERKAGVSSTCTTPGNGGRLDEAGVKWVVGVVWGVRGGSACYGWWGVC